MMASVRHRSSPNKKRVRINLPEDFSHAMGTLETTSHFKLHGSRRRKRAAFFGMSLIIATMYAMLYLGGTLSSDPKNGNVRNRRLLHMVHPTFTESQNPVEIVRISDDVRDSLLTELLKLEVDTSNLKQLGAFIQQSKSIVQEKLDQRTIQLLTGLHNATAPRSALLFRNLPVDPYVPPTPTDGSASLGKPSFVAEALLVALGELASAMVVGYASETEYSNPWIHEGFARNSPGSALTKATELSFHQDMSYHKAVPDILGLVCVREGHDRQVNTELIDNREILNLLPSRIVEILRQPRFQIRTSSWVDTSWSHDEQLRPLMDNIVSLHLPVDWENMVGLDSEAKEAVEMLKLAVSKAPKHTVHFVPGDLLLFSNRRTVHSRSPYTDLRFDGGDRVLDRAYFLRDTTPDEKLSRMIA